MLNHTDVYDLINEIEKPTLPRYEETTRTA
jgi:hypothetical protein